MTKFLAIGQGRSNLWGGGSKISGSHRQVLLPLIFSFLYQAASDVPSKYKYVELKYKYLNFLLKYRSSYHSSTCTKYYISVMCFFLFCRKKELEHTSKKGALLIDFVYFIIVVFNQATRYASLDKLGGLWQEWHPA